MAAVGCGTTLRSASHQASEAAVEGAAQQLGSAAREQTSGASSEAQPGVDTVAENLTQQVARGVLEALQTDVAQERLSAIAENATRAAVRESIQQLGKEATMEQLDALAATLGRSTARGAAESMPGTVGPAVADMLHAQIVPTLTRALGSPEVQHQLGETSENLAHEAVLGAALGIEESWRGRGRAATAGLGRAWLWAPLTLLGLICLTTIAAAVIVVARARRARTEVARLEDATLLLATAVRDRHQTEQADEVAAIVQQALENSARARKSHGLLGALRLSRSG